MKLILLISVQKFAHCIEASTIAEIACGQIGLNTMRVNLYTSDKLIGHQIGDNRC